MNTKKKVTTIDIAKRAGVSQATVSMILNNKKGVSFAPETKEKVFKAMKDLGYQKKVKPEQLKEQSLKNLILIICPILSNIYYTMLIHAISQQADTYGYQTLVAPTMRHVSKEQSYTKTFSNFPIAGIIFLYPVSNIEEIHHMPKHIPMVSIGEKIDNRHFDTIDLNSSKPSYLIGEHLLSLGHKKIGFISTPLDQKELARLQRLVGLRSCFCDHQLDPSDHVFVMSPTEEEFRSYPIDRLEYETGYHMALKLLDKQPDITAFVGINDMIAVGIMDALYSRKYKIPQDFSVCGFDNTPLSSYRKIQLTTVDHSVEQKGKEAIEIIHRKNTSKHNSKKKNYIMRLEYEPEVIKRSSTGPAKK
jgi:LacI family transcriptional regulator